MQALLEHFITQSTVYSLLAVMLVAFLESLALVGLILPGTVMMAGLGALIGGGEVNFWQAWLAGIVGCLLGDWISFWLGWRFKKPLHRWSFMKKNRALRAHFFFPCINSEIHAPGIYEFASQILFYACCRTKHKSRNAAFLTD